MKTIGKQFREWLFGPDKLSGLSRNGPQVSRLEGKFGQFRLHTRSILKVKGKMQTSKGGFSRYVIDVMLVDENCNKGSLISSFCLSTSKSELTEEGLAQW